MERFQAVAADRSYTSVVCVMELRHGARRHPQGQALWQRIASHVLDRFQILPIGEKVALKAGDVLADLTSRGEPIGVEDVLIGASALTYGLSVVTRNTKHFKKIRSLSVADWW